MGIVSALDGRSAVSVVHVDFGGQIVGRSVQVRNGGRGHRMLVRRYVIMQRVRGDFGDARVFLDGKVRGIASPGGGFGVSDGYGHPIVSGLRRKEFRTSGRIAETVRIVFPLVENDLLPRVRREGLVRGRTAYRYRGPKRRRRLRIERGQIGNDLVPFSGGNRRSVRGRLHRHEIGERGESHGYRCGGRGENRSCEG